MGAIESKKEKIKSKILMLEMEKSRLLNIKDTKVRELNEMDYLNKLIYEPPADKENKRRRKKKKLDSIDKGIGQDGDNTRNRGNGYSSGYSYGTSIGTGKGRRRNSKEDYDGIVDVIVNMIETKNKTQQYSNRPSQQTNDLEVQIDYNNGISYSEYAKYN